MKHIRTIAITLIAALLSIPAAGLTEESEYFPLKQGAIWVFENSRTIGETREVSDQEIHFTIAGSQEKVYDGVPTPIYLLLWRLGTSAEMDKSSVRYTDGVLYFTELADGDKVWFDFTAEDGDIISTSTTSSKDGGWTVVLSESSMYLGTEAVIVPAGHFSSCRKYRTMRIETKTDAGGVTEINEFSLTVWLAPGVGIVKMETVAEEGDAEAQTYTKALKEYEIP